VAWYTKKTATDRPMESESILAHLIKLGGWKNYIEKKRGH